MMLKKYLLFAALVSLLCVSSTMLAKPMPSPTKDEAVASPWIVVGRYRGYHKSSVEKIGYFNGVIAVYEVEEVIKNGPFPKKIEVYYEFGDGSACIAPEDWNFDKALMPRAGSKWILFLKRESEQHVYMTYRGDYGRWKATEENVAAIKKAVKVLKRD